MRYRSIANCYFYSKSVFVVAINYLQSCYNFDSRTSKAIKALYKRCHSSMPGPSSNFIRTPK
jgi:hypothetical protein